MSSSRWKGIELEVAKMFKTRRNPLSGGNGKHTRSDSLHPYLFIECKHGKTQKMTTLEAKTWELAKKEGKEPVIVKHPFGMKIKDSLATIRLDYLVELINFYENNQESYP